MSKREAYAIFKNIYRNDRADDVKYEAIKTVLDMETINGITKGDLRCVVAWLMGLGV